MENLKMSKCKNTLSKGSPYHVPNSDEMVMKFLCLKAFEKYIGDGRV
jgi:hypothetical protein